MLHFASYNKAQVEVVKVRLCGLNEKFIERSVEAKNPIIKELILEYDTGFTSRKKNEKEETGNGSTSREKNEKEKRKVASKSNEDT
jgi:hypothetical protein